jgi:hypothetical protein
MAKIVDSLFAVACDGDICDAKVSIPSVDVIPEGWFDVVYIEPTPEEPRRGGIPRVLQFCSMGCLYGSWERTQWKRPKTRPEPAEL